MNEWTQLLGGGLLLYFGAEWFVGGASALDLLAFEAQEGGEQSAAPNAAVEEDGDPALAVSIEAERPGAGLRVHFGRLGTIAIGLKV